MAMVFKCDRCGEIFNRKVPDINECYGTANSILFLDCTVERNRFGLGDNDEKRQLFETCNLKGKMTVNPIVDWSDDDVWDYTHSEHLPVNPLYCEGQKRVGCIGCPMAGRGADSVSLCAGLHTRKCTSQRLKECSMSATQKACRATGKLAWTYSAGGWKMTTSAVSLSMDDLMEDNNGTPE